MVLILSSLVPRDDVPADNNIDSILAITGTLTAISVLVVLLRLYVRVFMIKTFGWDDGVMAVTMVGLIRTNRSQAAHIPSGHLTSSACSVGRGD